LPIVLNGPEKQSFETPENNDEEIPNVTEWDKFQVHNYLLKRLPQAIAESLLVNVSSCMYIYIYIYKHSMYVCILYYIIIGVWWSSYTIISTIGYTIVKNETWICIKGLQRNKNFTDTKIVLFSVLGIII